MLRRLVFLLVASACLGWSPVAASAGTCPNEQLRVEDNSTGLPDCRAYEMVSPAAKNGGDITGKPVAATNGNVVAARAGGKVFYESYQAFADTHGSAVENGYLGSRGGAGWSAEGLTPTQNPFFGFLAARYYGFTADLAHGVLFAYEPPLTAGAPAGENLYDRDLTSGGYRTLTTVAAPETGNEERGPVYAGGSADLSHAIFEEEQVLTPEASVGVRDVYESVGGGVRLVSILPDGTVAAGGASAGDVRGATFGGHFSHAISDDGSRIFFTSPIDGSSPAQLYVRKDGTSTVEASASQRTTPDAVGPQSAAFRGASTDGSKVLFMSSSELTNDANTGVADEGSNLYLFDVHSGTLTDLTVSAESSGAHVEGVAGFSSDASRVYFVAAGVLASGATAGQANLYLWESGHGVSFIATFESPKDAEQNTVPDTRPEQDPGARITPDGKHLLFTTSTKLTAYENAGQAEIYRADAPGGALTCVSCNPSGKIPLGFAALGGRGGPAPPNLPTRSISDDGTRVFFNSIDALVPADVNAQQDVYEWENGQVHLISSGKSQAVSQFGDASASGDDVYFLTREQLLPQDGDDSIDIYDAHAGGGFSNPTPPASCSADACQGAPSRAPQLSSAGSATFTGTGNLIPTPASTVSAKKTTASQLRAKKLAKALKACRSRKNKRKRTACEASARKKYGPAHHAHAKTTTGRK
jgi:hypothetical protein